MTYYMKRSKIKWITLLIFTILIILVGFVILNSNRRVAAQPQEDVTIILSEVDNESGIAYAIAIDNQEKELLAKVEYDRSNMAGIKKYQEFNHRQLAELLRDRDNTDSIPLKITFSSPLTKEEVTEFVQQYEIDVNSYYIYMLEPDGNIATIQGSPSTKELVPSAFLDIATSSIAEEYSPGAKLLGWVEMDGEVQMQQITRMLTDKRVFLIDVMQLFFEARLTDDVLAKAGVDKDARGNILRAGVDIYRGGPLAWNLYYLTHDTLGNRK